MAWRTREMRHATANSAGRSWRHEDGPVMEMSAAAMVGGTVGDRTRVTEAAEEGWGWWRSLR